MVKQHSDEKAIFKVAYSIESTEARDDYLRQVCGDQPELHKRIHSLLQMHAEAPSFMEAPAVGLAATVQIPSESSSQAEGLGARIGPYKLRELLGEGGMGSVYVAEQEKPVRRKVAMKVIKSGMDSREVISRFEAERQALALMDHPNIAKVLDAGTTENGRPYFVMELVKGTPITEYCDTHELGTRERLEVFLQVCQAIQHAHQKAIIHRDLKPSNVLVAIHDTIPVVKVIDFGVAKAIGQRLTEHTLYTGFSQMIGTPLYMSPEQAGQSSLDIDTRSDVYALGVLLYELLTGCTPFESETLKRVGIDEMRRMIREVDPLRPSDRVSTLDAAKLSTIAQHHQTEPRRFVYELRGELDWVVMKAMEKDRSRRYESANAMARDVERFLNDEPVSACPPSMAYQLKKLWRRHRAPVLTASAVLVALLLTVMMALTLAVREHQATERRLLVQQGINDALTQATGYRGQARMSGSGDQAALSQAREQMQRALALAESGPADAQLVTRVRQLASELDQEQRDVQLLAALDAAWLAEPSWDWDRRFASRKSISHLRDALTADGLVVGQDEPRTVAARIRNRQEQVQSEIVAVLYEWYTVLAPPIGVILDDQDSGLVAYVCADSPAGRDGLLKERDRIVRIGQGTGGSLTSTAGLTTSQVRQLLRGEPGTIVRLEVLPANATPSRMLEVPRDTTAAWLSAVIQAADPDPWRQSVREACQLDDGALRLAELEKLVDAVDLAGQPVRFLNQLGAELVRAKAVDGATSFLKKVWQQYPDDVATNIALAICLRRHQPPQTEEALRYYTTAVGLRPESTHVRNFRGIVLTILEKYEEASADFRAAIRLDPNSPYPYVNLGVELQRQGQLDEAAAEYRKAIRLEEFAAPGDNLGRALMGAHSNLGNVLSDQGKLDEAIAEHREAIRLKPDEYIPHHNLGGMLSRQGKLDEAISEYREAIRLKPDSPETHADLGEVMAKQGKPDKAIAQYREAIRLRPSFVDAHTDLIIYLKSQEMSEEAFAQYQELVAQYREIKRLEPRDSKALNDLAWLLATAPEPKWRDPAQAVIYAQRAVQLKPMDSMLLNTLGVAHYRNGAWRDALTTLTNSEKASQGGDVTNWLFMAMAHWQLGEKEEASRLYDKSVAWLAKSGQVGDELKRFRAEAEELLGIPSGTPKTEEKLDSPVRSGEPNN